MWKSTKVAPASGETLRALIDNRVPAVSMSGFATPAEVEALARELTEHSLRTRSITQVTRLGISQYQQGLCGSKQEYFDTARSIAPAFRAIFERSLSPVDRFLSRLRELGFDADVMAEPGFGSYWAGTGKLRNGFSPIHVDFAPQDSEGWAIGESVAQLAWNFYLRVPPTGGELLVWDKLWLPEHDVHQVSDSYYYTDEAVEGVARLEFPVEAGQVVILNSRNFHAVAESEDRLAFGSFISVFDDGRLRLWS